MGTKKTREVFAKIADTPLTKQLVLVATGKFIGEGFDEPRLDTLCLAMPISWKGTLQQYAGRLHRLFENKNEVQIYDYVDIHVRMLERMYSKRLNGYSAIGYKAKGETNIPDLSNIIFDQRSFLPVYKNDLINAAGEIIIASPYLSKKHAAENLKYLQSALSKNVNVTVVTRSFQELDGKNRAAIEKTIGSIKAVGINVVCEPKLFQKFAVIDKRIVWYGSINLLGFGKTEESIMRLESPYIASELLGYTKK